MMRRAIGRSSVKTGIESTRVKAFPPTGTHTTYDQPAASITSTVIILVLAGQQDGRMVEQVEAKGEAFGSLTASSPSAGRPQRKMVRKDKCAEGQAVSIDQRGREA
jgi:hypothetical protein